MYMQVNTLKKEVEAQEKEKKALEVRATQVDQKMHELSMKVESVSLLFVLDFSFSTCGISLSSKLKCKQVVTIAVTTSRTSIRSYWLYSLHPWY